MKLFGKNKEQGQAGGGAAPTAADAATVKERLLQRRMDSPRGSACAAWVLLYLEGRLKRVDGVSLTLVWVEIRNLLGYGDEQSKEVFDRLFTPLNTERVTWVVHEKLKMHMSAAWALTQLGAEVCDLLRAEGRGTKMF